MKLKLFREFRLESEGINVAYHTTKKENFAKILKKGLLVNQPSNLTQAGEWADSVYKLRPIYVSLMPKKTKSQNLLFENHITLMIDVSGLDLVADLPSLVDTGAYYDLDYEGIYWDRTPIEFEEYLDDHELIYFHNLLDPYSGECGAAIELTGSAAILEDIEPSRILNFG